MNTSMSWIKMYVPDLDVTAQEYTDAMTLSGTKVDIRINTAHTQNIRMNGTAAQNFNPSGSFTEAAAFASAFEAGYIHFCTRLSKREVMRAEFRLCFRSE